MMVLYWGMIWYADILLKSLRCKRGCIPRQNLMIVDFKLNMIINHKHLIAIAEIVVLALNPKNRICVRRRKLLDSQNKRCKSFLCCEDFRIRQHISPEFHVSYLI